MLQPKEGKKKKSPNNRTIRTKLVAKMLKLVSYQELQIYIQQICDTGQESLALCSRERFDLVRTDVSPSPPTNTGTSWRLQVLVVVRLSRVTTLLRSGTRKSKPEDYPYCCMCRILSLLEQEWPGNVQRRRQYSIRHFRYGGKRCWYLYLKALVKARFLSVLRLASPRPVVASCRTELPFSFRVLCSNSRPGSEASDTTWGDLQPPELPFLLRTSPALKPARLFVP